MTDNIFKKDWMDWINFIIGILVFIAVVVGFYLNLKQLKELNAKAEIDLKFKLANSTLQRGSEYTEPFEINVISRNIGERSTNLWSAIIYFCKDVKVTKYDEAWTLLDAEYNTYFLEKNKLISKDKAFFHDEIDSIGKFSIFIPSNGAIPLASVFTSGEIIIPRGKLINFDWNDLKDPIKYEDGVENMVKKCSSVSKR